jgi:hypothetical protein
MYVDLYVRLTLLMETRSAFVILHGMGWFDGDRLFPKL